MASSDCSPKLMKLVLLMFNFVLVAVGVAMIAVGSLVIGRTSAFTTLNTLTSGATFIIVIGCFIVLVACFGFWGAAQESYPLMVIYLICLSLLFLCEFAGAINGFMQQNQIMASINDQMLKTMPNYWKNSDNLATLWDSVQSSYYCCGVFNASDWKNAGNNTLGNVPSSCCIRKNATCGKSVLLLPASEQKKVIRTDGCSRTLITQIRTSLEIIGLVFAIAAAVQLIGIIFAACLSVEFRASYENV